MAEKISNKISKVRLDFIRLITIDIRPLRDSIKRNHNNLFISLIKLLSFIILQKLKQYALANNYFIISK